MQVKSAFSPALTETGNWTTVGGAGDDDVATMGVTASLARLKLGLRNFRNVHAGFLGPEVNRLST